MPLGRKLLAILVVACTTSCRDGCGRRTTDGNGGTKDATAESFATLPARDDLPTITRWSPARSDVPKTAQMPGILLVHGAGGPELLHNKWMRPYTEALVAAGYDVFMPHYFEQRARPPIEIARSAITMMSRRPDIDPLRIGAVGFSRGGFIALETAAEDERIQVVVEFYGGMHRDVAARVSRMPPTLILHGDKDPDVGVEHAHDLAKLFEAKHFPYEMHVYPGEEHGFGEPALGDSAKRMVAFLNARLAVRPDAP